MREIKFRAWYKNTKYPRMYSVAYLHFSPDGDLYGILVGEKIELGNLLAVTDFELMQYTGLKDKKGNEIYEGDILRGYHAIPMEGLIFQVYWDRGGFIIRDEYGMRYDIGDIVSGSLEVIGNIYQHPELIKEE